MNKGQWERMHNCACNFQYIHNYIVLFCNLVYNVNPSHRTTHTDQGSALVVEVDPLKPTPSIVHDENVVEMHDLSDDNIALQFVAEYGNRIRYTPVTRTWYVWDGARWRLDDANITANSCRNRLRKIATKCFKAAYNNLFDPTVDPRESTKDRDARRRDAKKQAAVGIKPLKAQRKVDCVVRMSTYNDNRIIVTTDQWDGPSAKMLFNTPIGTVNLRTGQLHAPQQRDYITKMSKVSPAQIPTPLWDKFLREATNNDQELIQYIQRMLGYCLTGDCSEQTLFFCHGPPRTGKSVLTNVISYVMGEYCCDTSEGTFSATSTDRHTQDLARLAGSRFVTAQETKSGSGWNEPRIKRLTGQDRITARLMRQNDFTYTPQMKLFIIGNHKPTLSSVDDAIRRRFQLIPFVCSVPIERVDRKLEDALITEARGILHWMIQGCLEWQRIGLNPPKAVIDATNQYMHEEDDIAQWMEESCEMRPTGWTKVGDLYDSWRKWAFANEVMAGHKPAFSSYLELRSASLKIQKSRRSQGVGFLGVQLLPKPD